MSTPKAAILTIGDEILIGQITNTNTVWIAQALNAVGLEIGEMLTCGDQRQEILSAISYCYTKYPVVIVTGGLGPTADDLTKECLEAFFGGGMELVQDVDKHLEAFFSKRNRVYSEINRTQAILPRRCLPLMNHWGTAPGMLFQNEEQFLVSLPGVPVEMKNLMESEVIPKLRHRYQLQPIFHKTYHTEGIPESELMRRLESWESLLPETIKLAYLPSAGSVRLRLSSANEDGQAEARIRSLEPGLHRCIPGEIFGYDEQTLAGVIRDIFTRKGITLSVAESCTGGNIAHLLTQEPGISSIFLGGVVSYDNSLKINRLGVNPEHFHSVGAVSEEVVIEMAEGMRRFSGSDFAIATSGIAGPGGGTPEKPVGTVWIAWAGPEETITRCYQFAGDRAGIIHRASLCSLNILRKFVLDIEMQPSFWDVTRPFNS